MNLEKFVTHLLDKRNAFEKRLVVEIKSPGHIGGTPTVEIESYSFGIDWDNNKIILKPECPLMLADAVYIENARRELSNLGWTAYEFRNLQSENKRLLKRIKELETGK
jgi:hypothetical protein